MKQLLLNKSRVEVIPDHPSSVVTSKVNSHGREDKHDAFFVGDMGDVVNKYKNWISQLPRVEPFYAVKCNDDAAVIAVLAQLGVGFDCASKAEIQKVLDVKVPPSRIIYANPCKQSSFIQYAAKHNVDLMTFDNETELHKVKANHPNAKLVVRILPPVSNKCQAPLGMKFGCHPKQVPNLLRVAKQLDVDVVGVSFHVGSGCYDASAYSAAVASARMVFDMAEKEGFHFDLLDIGGGFPGQPNARLPFEAIAEVVRPALDLYFPESMNVRIIAEPGRYFVASAFTLAVNIIARRTVTDDDTGASPDDMEANVSSSDPMYMYYVNDGVYGSFNCILFDHCTVEASLVDPESRADELTYKCSIWGPTCDGLDRIVEECHLPCLETSDWLIFKNMGAYTMAAASTFNGMPKPKCYYVIQEHDWAALNMKKEPAAVPMKTGLDANGQEFPTGEEHRLVATAVDC